MKRQAALCLFLALSPVAELRAAPGGQVAVTVTVRQAESQIAEVGVKARRPRHQRGAPGETLVYEFTVRNKGNGPDRFRLTAVSSLGWPLRLPGGEWTPVLSGRPEEGRINVLVEVAIPLTELRRAKDFLALTATSQADPTVSAQAVATTTVAAR